MPLATASYISNMYGSTAAVERFHSCTYDPRNGYTIIQRYRGGFPQIQLVSNNLVSRKIYHTVEPESDGGYWNLEATYASSDIAGTATASITSAIETTYTIQNNDLEKSLWDLPNVQISINQVSTSLSSITGVTGSALENERIRRVVWLKSALEASARGEYSLPNPLFRDANVIANGPEALISASISETMTGSIADVLSWAYIYGCNGYGSATGLTSLREAVRVYRNGTTSWILPQTVMVKETIVPRGTTLTPTYTNVGRAFTRAKMITDESIPSDVQSALPTTPAYWFKKAPQFVQQGADKFVIRQEYINVDSVETFIYGGYIT